MNAIAPAASALTKHIRSGFMQTFPNLCAPKVWGSAFSLLQDHPTIVDPASGAHASSHSFVDDQGVFMNSEAVAGRSPPSIN